MRARFYVCPECSHTINKQDYEETLTANIIYTCPHCKHNGDAQIPFKRKKFQGVNSLIFHCDKCNRRIAITKKLKDV